MPASYRPTLFLLAIAQGLMLVNGVTFVAVTSLAGLTMVDDKRLATLPLTTAVIGTALGTLPAAFFMRRFGRRAGFMLGSAIALSGALLCALAIVTANFPLLCVGTLLSGTYTAFGQQYRFAAADAVPLDAKAKAISLTLAGGILGGIAGPALSTITRDWLTPTFLGTYLSLAAIALLAMGIASRLQIPALSAAERQQSGRPLRDIMAQPAYRVALLSAVTGYGVMNLLMTATPLAMNICRHPFADMAWVLEWHVLGMFAPSFFTGSLIRRVGLAPVLLTGAVLMMSCVGIAVAGVSLLHFWWALVLLGVGWNFLFIGGTTLLTELCRPEERAKVQGSNDFIVFTVQGATSLLSGITVNTAGWATLNLLALPLILFTTGLTLHWAWRSTR